MSLVKHKQNVSAPGGLNGPRFQIIDAERDSADRRVDDRQLRWRFEKLG